MPELIEVELYRRQAEAVVGRHIATVDVPDAWFVKGRIGAEALSGVLAGRRVAAARRTGKLLVLDLTAGPPLGVRFGMTGRLLVDGVASIEKLIYSSQRENPAWERFRLHFDDGGSLVVVDPRRLGGVELDPDEGALGPDAATVTRRQLAAALGGSTVAVKTRLMDQSRVAGVGNLIADEVLWRAGVDPIRPSGSLTAGEVERLQAALRRGIALLVRRGGSHTGDLMKHRRPGGACRRDGTPLRRATVGGRTTWWCPHHQV